MLKVKTENTAFLKVIIEWDEVLNKQESPYKSILENVEKEIIKYTLKRAEGIQSRAARILGINRNTLKKKIEKFGIELEE